MSLEAETLDLEDLPLWPEFTTKESDWVSVESSKVSEYLPPLSESVSVHITREKVKNVDWKVFKRFESDNIAGSFENVKKKKKKKCTNFFVKN